MRAPRAARPTDHRETDDSDDDDDEQTDNQWPQRRSAVGPTCNMPSLCTPVRSPLTTDQQLVARIHIRPRLNVSVSGFANDHMDGGGLEPLPNREVSNVFDNVGL